MAKANDDTVKDSQPQIPQTPGKEVMAKDTAVPLIIVKCSCGGILEVQREFAGKKIRCAKCGNISVAPMQSQLQESVLGKLQQKIVDLAKKLEEEQLMFRKSLEAKENEIKRLKEEFTEKENSLVSEKERLIEEFAERENIWINDKKTLSEEIVLLKANLTGEKNIQPERQEVYEKQFSKLSEELVRSEDKLREIEAEREKDRQEWEEKIAQLENQQIQLIEEELENLEKELTEERLIWRGKMSKEQSTEQPGL